MKYLKFERIREGNIITDCFPKYLFKIKLIINRGTTRYAVTRGMGNLNGFIPDEEGDYIFAISNNTEVLLVEERDIFCLN